MLLLSRTLLTGRSRRKVTRFGPKIALKAVAHIKKRQLRGRTRNDPTVQTQQVDATATVGTVDATRSDQKVQMQTAEEGGVVPIRRAHYGLGTSCIHVVRTGGAVMKTISAPIFFFSFKTRLSKFAASVQRARRFSAGMRSS